MNKTLKKVAIGFIALVVLLILVAYLLPRHVEVERKLVLKKAPIGCVHGIINDLKRWPLWMPWQKMDPDMKLEYGPAHAGAGAWYTWKSEKMGDGRIDVLASALDSISMTLTMKDDTPNPIHFFLTESPEGTEVRWHMKSDMGYNPAKRWLGLMMSWMLKKNFDEGLQSLDTLMQDPHHRYYVREETITPTHALSIHTVCAMDQIGAHMMSDIPAVAAEIGKQGMQPAGAPFSVTWKYSPQELDFNVGWPVPSPGKAAGKIVPLELPGGRALVADYYGPYEQATPAYEQMQKDMAALKVTAAHAPWEYYLTDPGAVKNNMNRVLTRIYWPVK